MSAALKTPHSFDRYVAIAQYSNRDAGIVYLGVRGQSKAEVRACARRKTSMSFVVRRERVAVPEAD